MIDPKKVSEYISKWLYEYCRDASKEGFVVGISGGIDSAVTSKLCAMTRQRVLALTMPIQSSKDSIKRSTKHANWLCKRHGNVEHLTIDMSYAFEAFLYSLPSVAKAEIAKANSRSRMRMMTLYAFAGSNNLLVAGTGNKVEDFGVGFYTKYGDGGVDISPIADLTKSEVRELAKHLDVSSDIIDAAPSDGLWEDGRSDEDQLGASYEELEWAMKYADMMAPRPKMTERQQKVLEIYTKRHAANKHKMEPIPVCKIPWEYR